MSGWAGRLSPSAAEIEALADAALAGLPIAFRARLDGVVVRVEEFATEEVLDRLGADDAFDVLGLFEGVGLAQDEAVTPTGRLPNTIWLYRRPILDTWAEHEERLGDLVAHVLVHEVGHHFGLSDEDIERIESQA